jgi:hypothetical protein
MEPIATGDHSSGSDSDPTLALGVLFAKPFDATELLGAIQAAVSDSPLEDSAESQRSSKRDKNYGCCRVDWIQPEIPCCAG